MQTRDREGREAATIAAVTDLDGKSVVEVGCGTGRLTAFADGRELVEAVSGWQGTRISRALARRGAVAPAPISVDQEVRLRVLRVLPRAG